MLDAVLITVTPLPSNGGPRGSHHALLRKQKSNRFDSVPIRFRFEGNLDLGVAFRLAEATAAADAVGMLLNTRPLGAARQNDKGDAPPSEVLLVASSSSKLASSAAFKSAPLLSVYQPLACAVSTVCPGSARINPLGVPWSKRTRTGWNRLSAEAQRHEVEYCRDLLARHVELLDNLVDAEILKILDDRGHGAGACP
jgi:hypothetical protein